MRQSTYRLLTPAALRAVALCLILHATSAFAGVQYRLADGALDQLSPVTQIGAKVIIQNVPLLDGKLQTLTLERFSVYAPDAMIEFNDGQRHITRTTPPATAFFRGSVPGDDESAVFIAVDDHVSGFVITKNRQFRIRSQGALRSRKAEHDRDGVYVDELTAEDAAAAGVVPTFECALDRQEQFKKKADTAVAEALRFHPAPMSLLTGTATYTIRLAVTTDGEFYANLSSNPTNVASYVANIVGAMSTIYSRDLRTDIQIAYHESFTNSATDPFTEGVDNGDGSQLSAALTNLQNHWTSSPPTSTPRAATMLFSGKYTAGAGSGGLAYVNQLGTANQYGAIQGLGRTDVTLSTALPGAPNPNGNANYQAALTTFDFAYWCVLGTAHELGHIVESIHTHCIPWLTADNTTYGVSPPSSRTFVDQCFSGEPSCYSNGSVGAVAANLPPELGTEMSYCHLIGGSSGFGKATRFTFGKSGETSAKVVDQMTTRLNAIEPTSPTISAPSTVGQNTSGNTASISSPSGTMTYLWTISGGTFSGGGTTATGTSVQFTVTTATPVKITATGVVNATGLASSDYVNVTVGGTLAAPTGVNATAGTTTSVTIKWNGVTGATAYHVYRASSAGGGYALIGSGLCSSPTGTGCADTVSAGAAYAYKVRAYNGAESTDSNIDVATTFTYTDPTLASGITIKSAHLAELQTAVDAVHRLAGLGASTFTETAATGLVVKAQQVLDLRSNLDAAMGTLLLTTGGWTDTSLSGVSVKAVHFKEIRDRMK